MTDYDIAQISIGILDARLNELHKRSVYHDKMAKYHYDSYRACIEDRDKADERINVVMDMIRELRGVAEQK